jgi:hypothetical protein
MNSTERLLITVSEVFEVVGRCVCPLPVVPHTLIAPAGGEPLRPGDQLELRKPDGTVIRVKLYGLGFLSPPEDGLVIQLEPSIGKHDVPIGSEIWKV